MSTTAVAPLSRRALERRGMTPEEELDLLVSEQQKDDTHYVTPEENAISLEAPRPSGDGTISDLIGVDEEGNLLVMFTLPPSPAFANASQHGTLYAYRRLGCKCRPCKAANAKHVREYRARKKDEA